MVFWTRKAQVEIKKNRFKRYVGGKIVRIGWCFGYELGMIPEFIVRVTGWMVMPFSENGNTGTESGNMLKKKKYTHNKLVYPRNSDALASKNILM